MKSLLVYLRPYKKESLLGPLFKMLEASFELFVPLVVAAIIDRGIGAGDGDLILRMGLVMAGLAAVGLVSSITAQYYAARAAVGFATQVRRALLNRIQRFSYTELDQMGTSTLITRMTSDVNQVQSGVNLTLRLFLRSPFIVFGAMVMAFTIDTRAALIFAAAIPVLALIVFGIMLVSIPLYKKVQAGLDRVLALTRENLIGVRVIRAFHREDAEISEFDARNRRLNEAQQFVGRISALMNPATYLVLNLALIALIWTGALRVDAGAITQGEVIALVSYLSQILVELIKLANLIITMTRAAACWGRVEGVLNAPDAPGGVYAGCEWDSPKGRACPPDGESLPAQGPPGNPAGFQALGPVPSRGEIPKEDRRGCIAVSFADVSVLYAGAGAPALTGVTFDAPRGWTVGVIGGTGSGKTTLVNLIPRFYDAASGSVRVNGVDVREWAPDELRARIGVVPQHARLFAGTVRENLCWGKPGATDGELIAALTTAQAWAFVERMPGGLDARIAQHGKNLSGGQKQRLTIARALVRRPEILILDDSASALDYMTDAKLRRAIREMEGAPTLFIVSQRAASVMHADLIVALDDGRVAGLGTHERLLEECAVYREIYRSQFPKEAMAHA